MMEKQQALRFLSGAMNDYVGELRRQGHRQVAESFAANANAALASLDAGESAEQVPEEVHGRDPN